jgi:hypothetical protein
MPDAPPAAHLRALGQRLDADGRVEFKNGSVVEVVPLRDQGYAGDDLRITWPGTTETGYVNSCAYHQLARAYALAMAGAPPPEPERRPPQRIRPRPSDAELDRRFGADCPF